MPDWKELVRERIGKLRLASKLRNEIVDELAAHLEDSYEEMLAAGFNESEALGKIWSDNSGWPQVVNKIERAKCQEGIMNNRTKQLWFPAFICLATSMVLMMALQLIGSKLLMPWKHATFAWLPYALWIVTLPAIGAITVLLSRRAGSTPGTRILVALFPPIVVTLLCSFLLVVLTVRGLPVYLLGLPFVLLRMVVVPGVALLAGSLPFMRREQLTQQAGS
jgi:hypothetical protein